MNKRIRNKKRGFSNEDLWNLDTTLFEFLLPRLKEFRKRTFGYPSQFTYEEWIKLLDDACNAIESYLGEDYLLRDNGEEDAERDANAIHRLFDNVFHLWY